MTSAKAWVSAITGALFAGLSSLAVVLIGDMTLADLTQGQWVGVAIAVVVSFGSSFGLTWAVTNKPAQRNIAVKMHADVSDYVEGMAAARKPST